MAFKRYFPLIALTGSILVTVLLLSLFQNLFSILNPATGIWAVPLRAEHPVLAELRLPGLKNEVLVVRDSWGVPHIYAESEEDVFYAFGYVQAQDRLWQMDLGRRVAEGMLSEIFGDAAYTTDVFFRTIGLGRAAQATYDALDPDTIRILEAFSHGVNEYIGSVKGDLPLEFKVLQYTPKPWTPSDTLALGKLIAWSLSGEFYDIEYAKLVKALGEEAVSELFPLNMPKEIWIIPSNSTQTQPGNYRGNGTLPSIKHGSLKAYTEILRWRAEAHRWLPRSLGSNSWVVSGSRSITGKPLLANDPHLQLTAPPVWYEAHLVVRGELNVRGVTFPGVPLIVIGRNERLAWGFTNVGADIVDFYYYVFSPDKGSYWYVDRWEPVKRAREVIKVKTTGGIVERELLVNLTRHGPLVERDGQIYAVRWVGAEPTFESRALYRMNKAKGLAEFEDALRDFHVPPQNVVYADIGGNIAYWAAGKYPIRGKGLGMAPVNGSLAEYEWIGYVPFEEVPRLINPRQGFIATANNRPAGPSYPYHLGSFWAPRYRAERIIALLQSGPRLSLDDMKAIQGDVFSVPASVLVPYLIEAYRRSPIAGLAEKAMELLQTWNYEMRRELVAPTIFAEWLDIFQKKVWGDEYSRAGIDGPYPFLETLEDMVARGESRWFDDVRTMKVEARDEMILASLTEALNGLAKSMGADMAGWVWGRRHQLSIEHPLGRVLDWLNYPKVPADGWNDTVNVAPGFTTRAGPSWRQIVDLSDPDSSLGVVPGGQSGNRFSRHWGDQLRLWLAVDYKPMDAPAKAEDIEDVESALRLIPS